MVSNLLLTALWLRHWKLFSTFSALACVITLLALCAPSRADCNGVDLFDRLGTEDPSRLAAIQYTGRSLPFGNGRMFRLSHPGIVPSILFGTLHLSDPRVAKLSTRVTEAIIGARQVAVEFVKGSQSLRRPAPEGRDTAMLAPMIARADQRPDRLLDPDDRNLLMMALAHHGISEAAARKLNPAALVLALDIPPCAASVQGGKPYAEKLIQEIAREHHIAVVGLETLAGQLRAINYLPREIERDLLISSVQSSFYGEDVIETEIRRYTTGDIGGLVAWMMSPEPIPGVPRSRIPPEFLKRLLDDRNIIMRDRALPLLKRGGAFIAVGAAHLPGEKGLVRLLQDEGYQVEVLE